VVTREALTAADAGDHKSVNSLLFEEVPHLILRLFAFEVSCNPGGVTRNERSRRQKQSARALWLAVERRTRGLLYAPFDVVDAVVDD
jgi:hypothetical protein